MRIALISSWLVFAISAASTWAGQPSMPGGWSPVPVSRKEIVSAAAFAMGAEQKALSTARGAVPAKLELVQILGASQQVVAGMNYRLLLKVRLNGEEKKAEAVVWWQVWRKPDPYQLSSWEWTKP